MITLFGIFFIGTVNELQERNNEFNETARVLVRRDLELTETNERLQEMDEAKSEFVSVAAHQLRTPLAGIKWTVYTLLDESFGKLNADQKKLASDAFISTNRLIDLINDLLDIARLEEGRFGFTFKRQDFVSLVKSVWKNFEERAHKKGIDFSLLLPDSFVPFLNVDEEKIGIVLDNIFDNAIKYTSPGGKVVVTVRKEEKQVIVQVRDSGIGIPRDQCKRVFTKFFRAENAQLYQTSGTGLGLYLTKNIIERHKGSIFFESKEGEGSMFTVILPIAPNV